MLRGVPGRVQHIEPDAADPEAVTIAKQDRAIVGGEGVLPPRPPFGGEVQFRPGSRRKLPGSRNEVRVDMGLRNVPDPHALGGGRLEVRLHVAGGVDDHGLTRGRAADEVARLRELFVVNPPENHSPLLR